MDRPAVFVALLLLGLACCGPVAGAEAGSVADVRHVFASWEEWEGAYGELVAALDDFAALSERPLDGPKGLVDVVEARDRVYRTARGVEGYLYLRLQLDAGDEEALSRQPLIDETDRRWATIGSPWFRRAVADLGREQVEGWIAGDATLRRYAFFFRRFFDSAVHSYPEGTEALRTLAGISGRQSSRVYQALAVSEAPSVEVILESGERLELVPARARTVLWELRSAVDRRTASKAWLEALGRRSQTYAALLAGIVEHQKLMAEVRGFDSALSAALDGDAISADSVRSVIRAARGSSDPLRRYHALRKRALGLEEYGLADRFVPLREGGSNIPFEEARRLVVDSSSALGPEVQEIVGRAFADGWIDSIERPGKRPHGGATFVPGAHPYVLVSYRGSLDSLFQLAHEIGHAVHSHLAHDSQPFVYAHPSSLTSETVASVFEGALVDHLVSQAATREERIRVLDLSIQNLLRLFHRPMLEADFELRLYETDQAVTGPSLGELHLALVTGLYGDTVSVKVGDAHGWQQTPHFYTSPLYLGRYGLSSAAANTLLSRLTGTAAPERAAAQAALLDLMRAGASGYPTELLNAAGVDLESPAAIDALLSRLASLVAELERAVGGAAPPDARTDRAGARVLRR